MRRSQRKVLHITPHAGGGVGAVLRALLKAEASLGRAPDHSIASLETINMTSKDCLDSIGVKWVECAGREAIKSLVAKADVVLLHWWNHPLLMKLLNEGLPECRLAIWTHVNGHFPPHCLFDGLFEVPDILIFATQSSFDAPAVKRLPETSKGKLRVIRSCSGIPPGASAPCHKTPPFQAGYVGTVDNIKMHPRFIELCTSAKLPEACLVAGGPHHEDLRAKAAKLGVSDSFKILGPVPPQDVEGLFRRLHAFAYPLNPRHYGSGEQVIVEAMAFGAVPVVLGNPPERALIKHGVTGLVAESEDDFPKALSFLSTNPKECAKLSAAAYEFVVEECGIERSQELFLKIFEDLDGFARRPRRLALQGIDGVQGGSPFHLFLSSRDGTPEKEAALRLLSGRSGGMEIPPSFFMATQGSPAHYLRFLGSDPSLEELCGLIETRRGLEK